MEDSNRGLLADLAKERMEREAKRKRVEEPDLTAEQKDIPVQTSQSADEKRTQSPISDVVELSDGQDSTEKLGGSSSKPDEVVLLSDDDDVAETAPKKTDEKPWELKVLTYNCWFEISVCLRERMAAIGAIIEEEKPDVIMMQEVVPEMEQLFATAKWQVPTSPAPSHRAATSCAASAAPSLVYQCLARVDQSFSG